MWQHLRPFITATGNVNIRRKFGLAREVEILYGIATEKSSSGLMEF